MQRRIALAISLALTVITTFSVITVGAKTGFFGGGNSAEAQPQVVEQPLPTAAPDPTQPVVAPAPPTQPIVITEYVYVDEPAPARPQTQPAPAASAGQVAAAAAPGQAAAPAPTDVVAQPTEPAAPTATSAPSATPPARHEEDVDDDTRHDEEHDEEGDDEHEDDE